MEMQNREYPISEIFTSQQGEGVYAGTLMTFVRLAGCNVGKRFAKDKYEDSVINDTQVYGSAVVHNTIQEPGLPIYTEKCTTSDGREFACDTDYRVKWKLSVEHILAQAPKGIGHFCITGGEPMLHNLEPLVRGMLLWLDANGYSEGKSRHRVHLETSGTKNIHNAFPSGPDLPDWIWITVSPKLGALDDMLLRANELKILVDEDLMGAQFPSKILKHPIVYLQPINGERTINVHNLKLVMELQKKYPQFRVSLQLHKVLEHFIEERVL